MNTDLEVLTEVPCFKCLFWKSERENQLLCNPRKCDELTEWLLIIAEKCEPTNDHTAVPKTHSRDKKALKQVLQGLQELPEQHGR